MTWKAIFAMTALAAVTSLANSFATPAEAQPCALTQDIKNRIRTRDLKESADLYEWARSSMSLSEFRAIRLSNAYKQAALWPVEIIDEASIGKTSDTGQVIITLRSGM